MSKRQDRLELTDFLWVVLGDARVRNVIGASSALVDFKRRRRIIIAIFGQLALRTPRRGVDAIFEPHIRLIFNCLHIS